MNEHPADDALSEEPSPPEVVHHLANCARCRVHRRLLRASDPGERGDEPAVAVDDPGRWKHGRPVHVGDGRERWIVWDRELERRVVRVTCTADADLVALQRFAEVGRRLAHPHIGAILALVDGPPLWYARDLVPGEGLGTFDLEADARAVSWLAQCASALLALHHEGVVHGELNEHTVRVTPEGRVVLVEGGMHAAVTPDDDWRTLGQLFEDLPGSLGRVVRSLADGEPNGGARLVSWVLASRDPTAGPRYQFESLLGVGGMGEVRCVRDPVLGRKVAQKVLARSLLSSRTQIEHFKNEAQITAQLQHPGIVPVHDLETLPNGAVAFTMKQIEGRTLAEVIHEVHEASTTRWVKSESGWTLRRLVEAVRQVANAIHYAHDQRVLHLDLKPSNIMVGDYGEVLIVDWGLARRLDERCVATLDRGMGTAGYASPEQLVTADIVVTPAADVYALGAVLREVLDGVAPGRSAAAAEWVPRRRDAPAELSSIVARATRVLPETRYGSARALAADLAAWEAEQVVKAHHYTALDRVFRALKPHLVPLVIGLVSAVVLVAAIGVGVVWVAAARERADANLAQALIDKANLALDAKDPVRAEAFAAEALGLVDRPDARGLLAHLARSSRPQLAGRWPYQCDGLAVAGEPWMVLCLSADEVRAWPVTDGDGWSDPESLRGLDIRGGQWTAFAQSTVRIAEATSGERVSVMDADAAIVDAVLVGPNQVAIATQGALRVHGAGPSTRTAPIPPCPDQGEVDLVSALGACGDNTVAVATEGGRMCLVDLAGAAPPVDLYADGVSGLFACSEDGHRLAILSGRAVQVWNVPLRVQSLILTGHLGEIQAVSWHPEGWALATSSTDGTVRIWNADTGKEIGRIPGQKGAISLAFSPDGASLFVAGPSSVSEWRLPDRSALRVNRFETVVELSALRWADDGSLFVVDRLGRPESRDARTGAQAAPIFLRVSDLDPAPTPGRVAVTTEGGGFGVLELEDNIFSWAARKAHSGGATAVAWRPGTDQVVSGGTAGDIRAWVAVPNNVAVRPNDDPPKPKPAPQIWDATAGAEVLGLRWSADGGTLAARTPKGIVLLDGGNSGAKIGTLNGSIAAHDVSADGQSVAVAWTDGGASVALRRGQDWRVRDLAVNGAVAGVAFSPTEPLLATVTREGLVQVFDSRTRSEVGRLFALPSGATDIAFCKDGSCIAAAGVLGDVALLETKPLLAPRADLVREVAVRYGVKRVGTELEFQ